MENQNQQENLNPTPQVLQPTLTPPPSNVPQPGKKFKLSIKAIIGIIIFLLLAGGAAASFTVFKPQILKLVSKPSPTVIPGLTRNPSSTSTQTPTIIQTPTPTPDPTTGWKLYVGDGFSFKYSPEWNYTTKEGNVFFSKKVRERQPTGPFDTLPTDTSVIFKVDKKALNETLDTWALNEVQRRKLEGFKPEIKKISASGLDVIETEFPSMNGEKLTVFIKGDNVYIITLEYATKEDEVAQKELKNQILSTFKFITPLNIDSLISYSMPPSWKRETFSDSYVVYDSPTGKFIGIVVEKNAVLRTDFPDVKKIKIGGIDGIVYTSPGDSIESRYEIIKDNNKLTFIATPQPFNNTETQVLNAFFKFYYL